VKETESRAHAAPLVSAERLCFAWRGRPVLREVSLAIAAGDAVALGASNGSGKTTLLRLLAGALEPDEGVVRRATGDRSAGSRVPGVVGAGDRGLYARLDVRANLELAVALALAPRAAQPRLVASALERFGLVALARRRVDRLSTGQRQRVRLALCFAPAPRVVLLDEPAASLDPAGLTLLADCIDAHLAQGGGALWTATGPPAAEGLPATHTCSLVDGRLRAA
jgi:ABC-type multidrug transport system ATPase subunit